MLARSLLLMCSLHSPIRLESSSLRLTKGHQTFIKSHFDIFISRLQLACMMPQSRVMSPGDCYIKPVTMVDQRTIQSLTNLLSGCWTIRLAMIHGFYNQQREARILVSICLTSFHWKAALMIFQPLTHTLLAIVCSRHQY